MFYKKSVWFLKEFHRLLGFSTFSTNQLWHGISNIYNRESDYRPEKSIISMTYVGERNEEMSKN